MTELAVLNFKAAKGKFDALGDMFRAVLGDTRAYDGCVKVDVYEDEGNNTITLVEEWESLAHQQKYLGWRIETGIQEATKDILEGGFDSGVTVHTWGSKADY
ncbi:MAG: antibiotic biosynthesis monooxygenase [Halieaceae bacterium]|jgi:quinol monooxygenase YgiN|nr:antibiotic biosynthesis monooxygenase [Halieaceae bacterium]